MELCKAALDTIDKLIGAPWFVAIGEPLEDDSAVPVHSWEEAMQLCLSHDWEDVRLDANNGIAGVLDRDHRDRYQEWNHIVRAVNSRLGHAVKKIARETIRKHQLPEGFTQVLESTTRMACVEAQYSDILAPGFFSEIASWYLVGHLPCGLTEQYPNGKLMVF